MQISLNFNYQNISYKSKIPGKVKSIKLSKTIKKDNLKQENIKETSKKNLPLTLMGIGLFLPVPFASVAGYVLGCIIAKTFNIGKK